MSFDRLIEKIVEMQNPTVAGLDPKLAYIPERIKEESFEIKVLPSFRPDRAIQIEKKEFLNYIEALSEISEINITSFAQLVRALEKRMDEFAQVGCCVADHGLEGVLFEVFEEKEIE